MLVVVESVEAEAVVGACISVPDVRGSELFAQKSLDLAEVVTQC